MFLMCFNDLHRNRVLWTGRQKMYRQYAAVRVSTAIRDLGRVVRGARKLLSRLYGRPFDGVTVL